MEKRTLKIYDTSDLHGYFYPTTYGDMEEKNLGLFKCAAEFERDENTLYLDGGDILQGSAFAYYCKQVLGSNEPIAEIMNACGCDYFTLGNHDFNYGKEYVTDFVKKRTGVCVCQNVTDEAGNILFPCRIAEMPNGLKVGIVGIVTDYVNIWEKEENLMGLRITDPFEAAKKALAEIKNGADFTICLYHGGFECNIATGERLSDTTENVGYRICRELDFDVLLTGHQHMSVDGTDVCGTYVVQPLENGKEYHVLQAEETENGWHISSEKRRPKAKADPKLAEQFRFTEEKVQKWLDEPLGHLSEALLPEDRAKMALRGSKIADFLNRVQLFYSGAQISAVGLANEIAGFRKEVKTRDIIATYPYPNTLVVCKMNGRQLKEVMERSAEYLTVGTDGNVRVSDAFLIPKVEHYNYDYFAGVTYRIAPEQAIGNRICDLRYQGKDVLPEEEFTVCVNNYRATGAGGYPAYTECEIVKEINVEMVELIMNYFASHAFVEI